MIEVKRTALIVSEIGWGFLRQRHHHLAADLARRGYEVCFLQGVPARTPPMSDLLRRLVARWRAGRVAPNADSAPPGGVRLSASLFMPHTNALFAAWNGWLARRLATRAPTPDLVYIFSNNPAIPQAFRRLSPRPLIVQDVIHNWWSFPWSSQAQRRNIRGSLDAADLIVSDSPKTLALASRDVPGRPTLLLLPAAGPEWQVSEEVTPTWEPHARPQVMFFGNLRGNSDIALLNDLSDVGGIDLVGYGMLDSTAAERVRARLKQAMRAPVPPGEVAAAARVADILVLPYAQDEFSKTISPAKYFECLASGAMVVSRARLDHLPGWTDYVVQLPSELTSEGPLRSLLDSHRARRAQQMLFAREHTWLRRFDELHAQLRVLHT